MGGIRPAQRFAPKWKTREGRKITGYDVVELPILG